MSSSNQVNNNAPMSRKRYLSIQWHITDNCDQRCKHCYIFAEEPTIPLYSTPFEKMKEVVDKCIAYAARDNAVPSFAITGGDPLLNPDFWELADYLKEHQLDFALMGNPFHLTEEVCQRLRDCGCIDYQVSIDGLRDTHDKLRKPGSFDATWACLPLLHKAGITSAVMTTVSTLNIHEVPAIIDLCVEHRVGRFAFARYVPTGSDKHNSIEPLEYRALLDTCYRRFKKYRSEGCWTEFAEKDHLFTLYKYEEGIVRIPEGVERGKLCGGCHAGLGLCILPDGTLLACRRTSGSEIGNIFDENFLSEDDPTRIRRMAFRNVNGYEDCGRCRLSPWCRGCHAVANGQLGDFFARDPQCWHIVE